jgi:DNA-binding NarL/FixJ family response regulator
MAIRIILADDHQIIRQGLRSLVEQQPDMEVLAEAKEGRTAVELVQDLRPDVVIMDVAMPELNGVEATRKIIDQDQHLHVVALSMHKERQYVARMLEAGASGYLLKDCAFEELVDAIRTVVRGQTYLSPSIAGTVVDDYVRNMPREELAAQQELTPREREVLQLMAEGQSTKEIARTLDVSVKTIETHRRNTMHKLEVDSVAELTKYAIREGITSLED